MAEEDRQRAAHAAHVSRTSHGAGGGRIGPRSPTIAKGARPVTKGPGIIAKAAMSAGSWEEAGVALDQDDPMTHPLYVNMKFPEYTYQEYPKWVIGDGTQSHHKLANDEEEERAILAGEAVVTQDEKRAVLFQEAEDMGIMVDKRWGVEKLEKMIEAERTK